MTGQQARPGHRRIGHRAQPLRVVVATMPRVGIGPGMVEHELAVGVGLQVAGDGADQGAAVPQGEVLRLPAPVVAQAAVGFHSGQEGVADEGIAAVVQRIPVGGGNGLQGVEEAGGRHGGKDRAGRVRTGLAELA